VNDSASSRTLSRHQVRDVDRRAVDELGMPSVVLMENAGRGAAELLMQLGIQGDVVICAGKGNNGGDGFVIARHLENHDHRVQVLLLCDPSELAGDAAINYGILEQAGTAAEVLGSAPDLRRLADRLRGADWIVDALLGTGTQGEIREPYRSAIELINQSPARVLAVDLPSGLDCDTGQPLGPCVQADHTATFVARKRGFDAAGAPAFTGQVHVIDIGVPRSLLKRIANH
jgi:NAD(P)H-hydrate epimerase